MNKFIRYLNQNRYDVIKAIAIIAFVIIIIQIINNLLITQNKKKQKAQLENNQNKIVAKDTIESTKSVITGVEISEKAIENTKNIVDKFVQYCNDKKIKEAYELLSNDCKNEFNNNIELFTNYYYKKIFNEKKTYSLELWINNTYRVKYYEDNLLATGGNTLNNNIQDYITITNESGENKLNINGFIGQEIINRSTISNGVQILVNSKKIYKDYEEYSITITNNTTKEIAISDGNKSKDICLLDENNVRYYAFINDHLINDFHIEALKEKKINIKFNKIYDIYRKVDKMEFNNINLNIQNSNKRRK